MVERASACKYVVQVKYELLPLSKPSVHGTDSSYVTAQSNCSPTMSKKPTWLLVIPCFARSNRGETDRQIWRSRSPCRKNCAGRQGRQEVSYLPRNHI